MQTNCALNGFSREFIGCNLRVKHGTKMVRDGLSTDDYTELMVEAIERRLGVESIDKYVDEHDGVTLKVKTSVNDVEMDKIAPDGVDADYTLLFIDKNTSTVIIGVVMDVRLEHLTFLANSFRLPLKYKISPENRVLMVATPYIGRNLYIRNIDPLLKATETALPSMMVPMSKEEHERCVEHHLHQIEIVNVTDIDGKSLGSDQCQIHGHSNHRFIYDEADYNQYASIVEYESITNDVADIDDIIIASDDNQYKYDMSDITVERNGTFVRQCNTTPGYSQNVFDQRLIEESGIKYAVDVIKSDDGKYVLVDDSRVMELTETRDIISRIADISTYDREIRSVPIRVLNMPMKVAKDFVTLRMIADSVGHNSPSISPIRGYTMLGIYAKIVDASCNGTVSINPVTGTEQRQWEHLFDDKYDFDVLHETYSAINLYLNALNEDIDRKHISETQARNVENAYGELVALVRYLPTNAFTKAMQSHGVSMYTVVKHLLTLTKMRSADGIENAYLCPGAFTPTVIACIKLAKYDDDALRLMSQWVNGVYDADYDDFKAKIRAIRTQPKNAPDRCFQLLDEMDEIISKLNILIANVPVDVVLENGFNAKNATAIVGRMTDMNGLLSTLTTSTKSIAYQLKSVERGNERMHRSSDRRK